MSIITADTPVVFNGNTINKVYKGADLIRQLPHVIDFRGIIGPGRIGEEHTMDYSIQTPGGTASFRWFKDLVVEAGETLVATTPDSTFNTKFLSGEITVSGGDYATTVATVEGILITYTPPTVEAAIPPIGGDAGDADVVYDLDDYFTGDGVTYSALWSTDGGETFGSLPSEITWDDATTLRIDRTAALTGSLQVTAANSGSPNAVQTVAVLVNVTPPVIDDIGEITSLNLGKAGSLHVHTGFAHTGGTLTRQWYDGASPISGETGASTIPVPGVSLECRAILTYSGGTVEGDTAAVAITSPVPTFAEGNVENSSGALTYDLTAGLNEIATINALIASGKTVWGKLACTTKNEAPGAPTNWTEIVQTGGGPAGSTGTMLTVWVKELVTNEPNPVIGDSGNLQLAYLTWHTDCTDEGTHPFEVLSGDGLTDEIGVGAGGNVAFPSGTPTDDYSRIDLYVTSGQDLNTAHVSDWPAALSSGSEELDSGALTGAGAGLACFTGELVTAALFAPTYDTARVASVSDWQARAVIAIRPKLFPEEADPAPIISIAPPLSWQSGTGEPGSVARMSGASVTGDLDRAHQWLLDEGEGTEEDVTENPTVDGFDTDADANLLLITSDMQGATDRSLSGYLRAYSGAAQSGLSSTILATGALTIPATVGSGLNITGVIAVAASAGGGYGPPSNNNGIHGNSSDAIGAPMATFAGAMSKWQPGNLILFRDQIHDQPFGGINISPGHMAGTEELPIIVLSHSYRGATLRSPTGVNRLLTIDSAHIHFHNFILHGRGSGGNQEDDSNVIQIQTNDKPITNYKAGIKFFGDRITNTNAENMCKTAKFRDVVFEGIEFLPLNGYVNFVCHFVTGIDCMVRFCTVKGGAVSSSSGHGISAKSGSSGLLIKSVEFIDGFSAIRAIEIGGFSASQNTRMFPWGASGDDYHYAEAFNCAVEDCHVENAHSTGSAICFSGAYQSSAVRNWVDGTFGIERRNGSVAYWGYPNLSPNQVSLNWALDDQSTKRPDRNGFVAAHTNQAYHMKLESQQIVLTDNRCPGSGTTILKSPTSPNGTDDALSNNGIGSSLVTGTVGQAGFDHTAIYTALGL